MSKASGPWRLSLGRLTTWWAACTPESVRLAAEPARAGQAADVLVVNTCAFIESAKQESVDAILEMAREKTVGRARRLVVTGCLAQRYDAELRREIPEIDATLGTGQVIAGFEEIGLAAWPPRERIASLSTAMKQSLPSLAKYCPSGHSRE